MDKILPPPSNFEINQDEAFFIKRALVIAINRKEHNLAWRKRLVPALKDKHCLQTIQDQAFLAAGGSAADLPGRAGELREKIYAETHRRIPYAERSIAVMKDLLARLDEHFPPCN